MMLAHCILVAMMAYTSKACFIHDQVTAVLGFASQPNTCVYTCPFYVECIDELIEAAEDQLGDFGYDECDTDLDCAVGATCTFLTKNGANYAGICVTGVAPTANFFPANFAIEAPQCVGPNGALVVNEFPCGSAPPPPAPPAPAPASGAPAPAPTNAPPAGPTTLAPPPPLPTACTGQYQELLSITRPGAAEPCFAACIVQPPAITSCPVNVPALTCARLIRERQDTRYDIVDGCVGDAFNNQQSCDLINGNQDCGCELGFPCAFECVSFQITPAYDEGTVSSESFCVPAGGCPIYRPVLYYPTGSCGL